MGKGIACCAPKTDSPVAVEKRASRKLNSPRMVSAEDASAPTELRSAKSLNPVYANALEPSRAVNSISYLLQCLRFPVGGLVGATALSQGLDKAIKEYTRDVKMGICNGPYPVAEGVLFSVYEAWATEQESCWRLGFVSTGEMSTGVIGNVYLFGDPSLLHERVVAKLWGDFWLQLGKVVEEPDELFEPIGSTRYTINLPEGGYVNKEPDGGLVPASLDKSFPTLVFEFAYKNESYSVLKKEVTWWAIGGAPVSIGIKVNTRKSMDLKFVMVDHETGIDHVTEIDFSPQKVQGPGQEVIRIPLKKLTRSTVTRADLETFEFVLDLFKVQNWIIKANEAEPSTSDVCFCSRPDDPGNALVFCTKYKSCYVKAFHADCVDATDAAAFNPETTNWICPYCR